MENQYIFKIEELLPKADVELLDFIYQFLYKSVNPAEEHQGAVQDLKVSRG